MSIRIYRRLHRNAGKLQGIRERAQTYERLVQQDIAALLEAAPHGEAKRLALAVGISEAYLCDIRHGRRGMGDDTVVRLVTATDHNKIRIPA